MVSPTMAGEASTFSSVFFASNRAVPQHERHAAPVGDEPARGADRRREHLVEAVEPLCLVVRLAGLRVECRQDAQLVFSR
jgi:hypothetical protein